MSRMNRKVKDAIFNSIRNSGKLEQEYVIKLMDLYCEKIDTEKIIQQYKKARANRLIASFKDENGIRDCFVVKDGTVSTYVNISTTDELPLVKDVIGTLHKKIKGTNKSLQKAIKRGEILEGQIAIKEMGVKVNA